MNGLAMMMTALHRFCARHNLPVPTGVEVRFADEGQARGFEDSIKLDFKAIDGTINIDSNSGAVDKVCNTPLHIAYAENAGRPVLI